MSSRRLIISSRFKICVLPLMAVIVLAVSGGSAIKAHAASNSAASFAQKKAALKWTDYRIQRFQATAWRWESILGRSHSRSSWRPGRVHSLAYDQWVLKFWQHKSRLAHAAAKRWMQKRTQTLRVLIRRWDLAMGVRPSLSTRSLTDASVETAFNHANHVAQAVYGQYANPPQKANFECIHRYEGSWTDRDSGHNGHYGGVQMGKAEWDKFGEPYTGKKYPYQASKLEQLWAAGRYWEVSGFHPWPATAHDCGLL